MFIVAFSGKRGTGKTTAAKYLERYYGFTRLSFASPLRRMAKSMFDLPDDALDDPKKKEAPFKKNEWSPRELMVNLGAFLRYHDPDYFVKVLEEEIVDSEQDRIVIDDLRFPNEAKMLQGHEAKIIRLNRYIKDIPYKGERNDESEIGLDGYQDFDFIVHEFENRNLRQLTDRLDFYMDELGLQAED